MGCHTFIHQPVDPRRRLGMRKNRHATLFQIGLYMPLIDCVRNTNQQMSGFEQPDAIFVRHPGLQFVLWPLLHHHYASSHAWASNSIACASPTISCNCTCKSPIRSNFLVINRCRAPPDDNQYMPLRAASISKAICRSKRATSLADSCSLMCVILSLEMHLQPLQQAQSII